MVIMSEEMTAVVAAEKVVAEIEDRRRQLLELKVECDEKRRRLSYSAVAEKDEKAVKALASLAVEANKHTHELESLLAAAAEADQRLAAARHAEAQEAAKMRALAIRECCAEFLESALSLNEAILALSEEGAALQAAVRKLRTLGVGFPTDQQVSVLGLQCLQTGLMETAWRKEFPHLAPKDRRSWSALSREWVARIESTYVQPHLGEAPAATIPDDLSIPISLRRELPPPEVQQ
jgi:hypothetical protein